MTDLGLVRERVRVFTSMLRSGATKEEAFAYLELIYPFGDSRDGRPSR